MKIGYLHLGSSQHGVSRYGRLLATEAKQSHEHNIVEVELQLTDHWSQNLTKIYQAAQVLSEADVVHLQYNKSIWGKTLKLCNLWTFLWRCKAPLVVTVHDIYWQQIPFQWHKPLHYLKTMYGPTTLVFYLLCRYAQQIFVCTEQEAARLKAVASFQQNSSQKVKTIPHFVEKRADLPNSEPTRQALQLQHARVITLLGWIHPRKGHRLLVEAMPMIPTDVQVVFAGQPSEGSEAFLEELLERARTLGVVNRLRTTGYLSEAELEQYLAITDLAVCPFMNCSASGSLSTWISIAHPKILAFSLPQIEEYNLLEPGAVYTFKAYTETDLAQSMNHLLSSDTQKQNSAVKKLQQRLCISTIFDEHLAAYHQVSRFDQFENKPTYLTSQS